MLWPSSGGNCSHSISRIQPHHHQTERAAPLAITANRLVEVVTASSSTENSQTSFLSSFKYKKEAAEKENGVGGDDDYECPVCLSAYEEGEEVRKLPRCKHCFHAPCIDMWLHSHFDCPICRTPVRTFCHIPPENSRHRLVESGGVSVWLLGSGTGGSFGTFSTRNSHIKQPTLDILYVTKEDQHRIIFLCNMICMSNFFHSCVHLDFDSLSL